MRPGSFEWQSSEWHSCHCAWYIQVLGIFITALHLPKGVSAHCCRIPSHTREAAQRASFCFPPALIQLRPPGVASCCRVCHGWQRDVSKGQRYRLGVGGCLTSWGFLGTSVHRCIWFVSFVLNGVGISQSVLVFFFIWKASPEVGWAPGEQCHSQLREQQQTDCWFAGFSFRGLFHGKWEGNFINATKQVLW